MTASPLRRILFVNRSYWPDAEATGQLLTELCEDLAGSFEVHVVAGQPNQNPTGARYRTGGRQVRQGVTIHRVWNSRLNKSFLPGRLLNLLTFLLSAFRASLCVKRPDLVVVETDPPLLCLLGALLRRWHRAKLVVYLQDIYPDIAVALGKIPDGRLARRLRQFMFGVYGRADRVVVLSRDMRDLLVRAGVSPARIECIPNWVDTSLVVPRKEGNAFRAEHGLDGQFVVMYSGNMGLCQRLDDLLEAAFLLRGRQDILFVLVGDGVSRLRLEETARRLNLGNVRFLPYQPKDRLADSLSAADVHLVPLDPRVSSCLMPSKLYGILASGTPLVAVAPEDCELAEITRREGIGIAVAAGRPDVLAETLCGLAADRGRLASMGRAARALAESHCDRLLMTRRFARMLGELAPTAAGQPRARRWSHNPA